MSGGVLSCHHLKSLADSMRPPIYPMRPKVYPTRPPSEPNPTQWNILRVGYASVRFALIVLFFLRWVRKLYPTRMQFSVEYGPKVSPFGNKPNLYFAQLPSNYTFITIELSHKKKLSIVLSCRKMKNN